MSKANILAAVLVVCLSTGGSFVMSTWVASRAYLKRGEQQEKSVRTLDVTWSVSCRLTVSPAP